MTFIQLTFLALAAFVWRMSEAQSLGRVRNVVPMALVEQCPSCSSSCSSSCTVDDLSALIILARALDDKPAPANNGLDVDGIISKLINALVFTTTQNAGNGGGYKSGQGQTAGRNGNGHGLIDLDVLGPNGLLDLDVGGTRSNGSSSSSASSQSAGTRGHNEHSQALIDLDVLGPRPNDVAKLKLAGNKILDVDLGKGGSTGATGAVSGLLDRLL